MRNLFESIAVGMVLLLSIVIVILIVQYNMIQEDTLDNISAGLSVNKQASPKSQASNNYLDTLEGYSDVDVKVDPTKEDKANRVVVKAESTDNSLGLAVEDTYVEKLEHYQENVSEETNEKTNEKNDDAEPEMPQEEIEDEIGMAIDEVLKDL